MNWTAQDTAYFASLVHDVEDDDSRLKKEIKEKLLSNKYIIHALDCKDLEEAEAEPDEYFGKAIFPYYLIHPVQVEAKNFICFETQFSELERNNSSMKIQQLVFYIVCEQKNQTVVTETDSTDFSGAITEIGVARHDLIASLLIHEFNHYPFSGGKARLVSNIPNTTDDNYAIRKLIFEFHTDTNLVKTINGKPEFVNKVYAK